MIPKQTQPESISPRAIEIYDEVMESIGMPELKMENADKLDEEIPGESAIDKAARLERYDAAFSEAERILDMRKLGHEVNVREMVAKKRAASQQKEVAEKTEQLETIEDQLDSQIEE